MKKLMLVILMVLFCISSLSANTYKNGKEAYEMGDYTTAEKMFRGELEQVSNENKPAILSLLSKTYFKLGRTTDAAKALIRIWEDYPTELSKEDRQILVGLYMYTMSDLWERGNTKTAYELSVLLYHLTTEDSTKEARKIATESYLSLYVIMKLSQSGIEDKFLLRMDELPTITWHTIKTGDNDRDYQTETLRKIAIWGNIVFEKCLGSASNCGPLHENDVSLYNTHTGYTNIRAYFKYDIRQRLYTKVITIRELQDAQIMTGTYEGMTFKNGSLVKVKLDDNYYSAEFCGDAFFELCDLFFSSQKD